MPMRTNTLAQSIICKLCSVSVFFAILQIAFAILQIVFAFANCLAYGALSVSRVLLANSCSSACEDHSAGEQNVAVAAVFHCDSYLLLIGILYALQTFVSYCQITVVVGVIIFACCEVKNTEWLKQKLKTMQRRC